MQVHNNVDAKIADNEKKFKDNLRWWPMGGQLNKLCSLDVTESYAAFTRDHIRFTDGDLEPYSHYIYGECKENAD